MKLTTLFLLSLAVSITVQAQTPATNWQNAAIQKYPNIGIKDTDLNRRFVEAVTARRKTSPELFQDPKWPLIIADEIAKAMETTNGTPTGKTLIQGKDLFSEAQSKTEKTKVAKDLLAVVFKGFPQSVCKASLIGSPTIISQNEKSATLRLRVRIGIDLERYAAWLKTSLPILRQISQKTTHFRIPREKPLKNGDLFSECAYSSKGPDIQDDPALVRFNPELDGLLTLRQFNERFAENFNVGVILCVSNTIDGLSGEAYTLGEDEYATLRSTLASTSSEHSDWNWNQCKKIQLCFKNTDGELVKTLQLKAGDGKGDYKDSVFKWFAPYGKLVDTAEFGPLCGKQTALESVSPTGSRPKPEDYKRAHRNILIQPGFFIDNRKYERALPVLPTRTEAGKWSVTAVYGAAFDFTVTVTTDELRSFHNIDILLE